MDDLSYFVSLDGLRLNDLDPSIHIANVEEQTPARTVQTTLAGRIGSRVLRDQVGSISVRVLFVILTDDLARRKAVCGKVAQWARNGRFLMLSDRPGQRLQVMCTALPSISSAQNWGQTLSLTFAAYTAPWWESELPTEIETDAAAEHQLSLRFVGTQPEAWPDITITARADVDAVIISANEDSMVFTGLGMAAGDQLHIRHEDGLLVGYKLSGGVRIPCMSCRTAGSCDELALLACEDNSIHLTADAPVTAVFSVRGRFD